MAKIKMSEEDKLVANSEEGIAYRKKQIDDFLSQENCERKEEACRRYEIFRDGVKPYVEKKLKLETNNSVVHQMMNRVTNINLAKKIVNKLARVYKSRVTRKFIKPDPAKQSAVGKLMAKIMTALGKKPVENSEDATAQVELLSEILKLDVTFKKANRFLELFRNTAIKLVPYSDEALGGLWNLRIEVLNPSQYDVIEDEDNPTRAVAFVESSFGKKSENVMEVQGPKITTDSKASFEGARDADAAMGAPKPPPPSEYSVSRASYKYNDEERKNMEFVFWTPKYHFTCNGLGTFKDSDDFLKTNPNRLNMIASIPVVFLAKDQDGSFWGRGGEDLADGTILLNLLTTDLNFLLIYQGMGLLYVIGPSAPDQLRVGAHRYITMKTTPGQHDTASVGYASSNPPVESHLKNIEQLVAMILSTNNLEPSSVSSSLNSGNITSGVHELVRRADVTEAIEDEQEFYRDAEQALYKLEAKWVNWLIDQKIASEEIKAVGTMNESAKITIEYRAPEVYVTEKERLDVIEQRLAIPLDTMVEAIKRDNPSLTDDDAKKRLEELKADMETRNGLKMILPKGETEQPGTASGAAPTPPGGAPTPPANRPTPPAAGSGAGV